MLALRALSAPDQKYGVPKRCDADLEKSAEAPRFAP
ncbi:hypothetical protein CMV_015446, partial [Castanea mollissima]